MAGRYFDEWTLDDHIMHEIRRTVTETDNLLWSTMTHNPQPLHLDAEAAKASEFGQILVNGTFTFSLMVGLSVGDTTLGTLVANLGYTDLNMPKPVFIGDTLRAETNIAALRESKSHKDAGIVTFKHILLNQRGEIVCECLRSALLKKKTVKSLRSLLFVPADRPERFAKAAASGADAIIIDLEDSVAPANKQAGRDAAADWLRQADGPVITFVRINPLDSEYVKADLECLTPHWPDAIVLPKAEGAASVNQLLRHASNLPPIMPIATETPGAVFELGSFRNVADKLIGLSWGAEDLPAAIGAATSREQDGRYTPPYEMVRSLTLFAAHAAGVPAIDTVFPDIKNTAGLSAYVARAARDGFTGMLAIHPSQIAAINEGFMPSQKALADAQAIVDAFAANPGAGALQLNGKMIDAPHLKAAQNIIERAKL